jgi:hypothetical protein
MAMVMFFVQHPDFMKLCDRCRRHSLAGFRRVRRILLPNLISGGQYPNGVDNLTQKSVGKLYIAS